MHLVFELIASMNEEESNKTTITNSSWTKASLRWSIKVGNIGLRSEWLAWVGIWCRDTGKLLGVIHEMTGLYKSCNFVG